MDELLEYPYFRKLFEDFTGTTDTICRTFIKKIGENISDWKNTVLDDHLSLILSGRWERYVTLEINGVKIGNPICHINVISVLKDLLDGKNLPISKGIDPRICEFLEHSNFLSNKNTYLR